MSRENSSSGEPSFAQKNWRIFEELALTIVKSIINVSDIESVTHLTDPSNDGGYDGYIAFPLQKEEATILYRILVEAKLRSSSTKDLPLSDFAKTIIIAINSVADKVYIITNAYFSEETQRRLQRFAHFTGLEICLIDIGYISKWIEEHPHSSLDIDNKEFLQTLVLMGKGLKQGYKQLLPPSEVSNQVEIIEPVIGKTRLKALDDLTQKLFERSGIVVLTGPSGSGKTVFTQNLVKRIRQYYPITYHLDLSKYYEIREIFVQLLSMAWGMSSQEIFAMDLHDLEVATTYVGEDFFPEPKRKLLLAMIHQPREDFEKNYIFNTNILLSYLVDILKPILHRRKIFIHISNIEELPNEGKDFLLSFIRMISKYEIGFLVKIQKSEIVPLDAKMNAFLQDLIRTKKSFGEYNLPAWDISDAQQYLDTIMPNLSIGQKNRLIQFCGPFPLTLSVDVQRLKMLSNDKILPSLNFPTLTTQERNHYTFNSIDQLLKIHIQYAYNEVQYIFVLLGLFDGTTSIEHLKVSDLLSDESRLLYELKKYPYLHIEGTSISVRHGAYRNSLMKFEFEPQIVINKVFNAIEPVLDTLFADSSYVQRKRFLILKKTKDYKNLDAIWRPLAAKHLHHREAQLGNEVLHTVYDEWVSYTNFRELLSDYDVVWLLYHLISTTKEINGSNDTSLTGYYEQLSIALHTTNVEKWPGGLNSLRLSMARACVLHCQTCLGQGKYHEMINSANQGLALLQGKTNEEAIYCKADLWANKALGIKHTQNINACLNFLEKGIKQFGRVRPLLNSYYTHLSSRYSVKRPEKAIECFRKVLEIEGITLAQELHAKHNIASMHFALKEYEKAETLCKEVLVKAYENNIITEEMRSYHLLGCIAWVRNEFENAKINFSTAYQSFTDHLHHTHNWPPVINLSTLCLQIGEINRAYEYLSTAVRLLLDYHLDSINHLSTTTNIIPKLYVGVLVVLDHFDCYFPTDILRDELLEKITLKELHETYTTYVRTGQLRKFLYGSGYLYGDKIILKI